MPPLPPLHVPRPRLVAALNGAQDSPLTLLSAGPGVGKTVLLAEWAQQCRRRVAWLTVTPEDNELGRFWRMVFRALRTSQAGDELPAALLDGDTAGVLESMFMQVPASRTPVVLVIDEAHLLTHPRILDGLDHVIRGWHAHVRLVLAARSDPLLPLHRYRMAGQMAELRAADLAMTRDETAALLAVHGVALPDDMLDVLTARTEGWTAGIRLSAIRMTGAEHPEEFVAEFAVDQGSIGEYLINEVLARQPEPVRELLIQTGFLDEVSGPLADAITGSDGSGEVLAELARANSFVMPVDRARTRFRYHQLFAEILQYVLRQQAPRQIPTLHARAADWYEAQGDVRNAIKWAAQAGDGARAAALLVRGGLAGAYVHRTDPGEWASLPGLVHEAVEGADPAHAAVLNTARAAITAITARADTAADELDNVRALRATLTDPDLAMTGSLAELVLAEKAGDGQAVEKAAEPLSERMSHVQDLPVQGLRACVTLSRARARFWDGRYDDVDALLQEAVDAARADGATAVELDIVGMTALVDTVLARYGRADEAAARARELERAGVSPNLPITLELAEAMRAYVAGDFGSMAWAVQRAAGNNGVEWDCAIGVLLTLVRAQLLLGCGQYSEARAVLQGTPALRHGAPAMLAARRDMMLADIETALGRPHGALRLLQGYRSTRFEAPVAVSCARACLALGDIAGAQNCVRRALTGISAQLGRYSLIEAILCDGEIAQLREDPGRALEMIVRAIDIANGDILLPFVHTADVFAALLARHPTVAARWPGFAVDLAQAADIPNQPTPSLPEVLTDRERAVLRLLATSMTTAEIADELCVSVNTVKTHLAAIYRKLAASRRREAILRARELELL